MASSDNGMRNIASTKTNIKPKTKSASTKKKVSPSKKKSLWKKILIFLVIILLLVGSFFIGIYLRLFNTKYLNSTFHFDKWPVIGTYFKDDDKNDKTKEVEKVDVSGNKQDKEKQNVDSSEIDDNKTSEQANKPQESQALKLSKKQIEEEQKAQQAAINNRISQLAQVFAQMDPQKAASIMENLNSNMAAAILQQMDSRNSAQIISAFSPDKGAQITQILYNGVTLPTISDLDVATNKANNQ